jgi:hypothetical protein
MVLVIIELIIEKNFKTIYKQKHWQRIHYTSKAKQGNADNAEWTTGVGDKRSSSSIKAIYIS